MRMQIYIGYANVIGPLALISNQSHLAHPGLTRDLQIETLLWHILSQPILSRF